MKKLVQIAIVIAIGSTTVVAAAIVGIFLIVFETGDRILTKLKNWPFMFRKC
jgi:hypothetical protein